MLEITPLRGGLNKKRIGQAARPVSKVPSTDMKSNSFTALLVALLLFSSLVAAVQVLRLSFATRDLRRIQSKLIENSSHLNLTQALLNDTLEYSKHNPAIDPLLQSMIFKTNASAGTARPQSVSR